MTVCKQANMPTSCFYIDTYLWWNSRYIIRCTRLESTCNSVSYSPASTGAASPVYEGRNKIRISRFNKALDALVETPPHWHIQTSRTMLIWHPTVSVLYVLDTSFATRESSRVRHSHLWEWLPRYKQTSPYTHISLYCTRSVVYVSANYTCHF